MLKKVLICKDPSLKGALAFWNHLLLMNVLEAPQSFAVANSATVNTTVHAPCVHMPSFSIIVFSHGCLPQWMGTLRAQTEFSSSLGLVCSTSPKPEKAPTWWNKWTQVGQEHGNVNSLGEFREPTASLWGWNTELGSRGDERQTTQGLGSQLRGVDLVS